MAKSPDAFRTISEVADWLGIQAHVLRFWESKFTQVKPIKRAGGRRYYRPGDMLLLGGIKKLLHDDGLTIKGVQKILREEGMSHVADMSAPLDELTLSQLGDSEPSMRKVKPATAVAAPEEEKGVVLSFDASKPDADPVEETVVKQEVAEKPSAPIEPEIVQPETLAEAPEAPEPPAKVPTPELEAQQDVVPEEIVEPEAKADEEPTSETPKEPAPVAELPAFLRRPLADQDTTTKKPGVPAKSDSKTPPRSRASEPESEPAAPAAKKPRVVDLPAFTAEDDFSASPAALTAAFRARKIAPANAAETRALLHKLAGLRDQMAARRRPSPPSSSQD